MKRASAVLAAGLALIGIFGCTRGVHNDNSAAGQAKFTAQQVHPLPTMHETAAPSHDDSTMIVIDDLPEDMRDSANEFATAFALDPSCAGLTLLRITEKGFRFPSEYWYLHAYNRPNDPDTPQEDRHFNWDIIRGEIHTGFASSSELSSADAAHHVCAIVNHRGGQVR